MDEDNRVRAILKAKEAQDIAWENSKLINESTKAKDRQSFIEEMAREMFIKHVEKSPQSCLLEAETYYDHLLSWRERNSHDQDNE